MKLTDTQDLAVESIHEWLMDCDRPTFILAGYAGTGKTTILQEFINSRSEPTLCIAPTGKAASVLGKRLTNARVSTIHRALYKPVTQSLSGLDSLLAELLESPDNALLQAAIVEERARLAEEGVGFRLKEDCAINPGTLAIVDEASMVTSRMHTDLLNTGAKILYVGDPGQLPPVMDAGFFRHHPPDVMLTEVMRQALDSPIIRLSMAIRNGVPLDGVGLWDDTVQKLPKASFPHERWLEYDQIITGSNEARRRVNKFFRTRKFGKDISWWPLEGDKLICLKNEQMDGNYFINGVIGAALSNAIFEENYGTVIANILYEGSVVKDTPLYRYPFQVHYDARAVEENWNERRHLREFDYGYGITVHKAQGSEFDKVILADDGMMKNNREFRRLWLYTAVTRAKKELVWLY